MNRPAGAPDHGAVATPGPPRLILASGSPRREELLAMLGLDFEIIPADIPEVLQPDEDPAGHVERLAREKALAVALDHPDALVVGSDTLVVVDHKVLGKPADAEEAVAMLLELQGEVHRVETGVAVVAPGGRVESSVVGVRVWFRPFNRRTAEQYVATGEPLDKAGSYGIQGFGSTLVERIEGDYFAVMGLPVARLVSLLRALGWHYAFGGLERVRPS